MKQFLEGIISLRTKIVNRFHNQVSNSYNKVEYHFHDKVIFINKPQKSLKTKS